MAVQPDRFSQDVGRWASATEARTLAVVRTALQDLDREVSTPVGHGGNMPVVTGNLRRSRLASTEGMPSVQRGTLFKADPGGQIALVIAGFQLGQRFMLGFQAVYARRVEERYGFVRLATQRWKQIVRAAASKVQVRSTGRLTPGR